VFLSLSSFGSYVRADSTRVRVNLASTHWSEEELSYVFNLFTQVRNHQILWADITMKKGSVLHIHCNKCDTDFQCTSFNYVRTVNKDNVFHVLEKIKSNLRPKPDVCLRCKSISIAKFNNARKGKDHPIYVHGLSSTEQQRPNYDPSAYKKEWSFQIAISKERLF